MANQIQKDPVLKLSLIHGLLLGIVSVVLSIIFSMIDPVIIFTNFWIGILILIIVIVLMVVLGLDVRKKIGGFWSFGEAFKSLIIMAVVLVVMSTLYNFILFKFVDPGLPAKANSALLDKITTSLNNSGVDQSRIDEYTKQFQDGEFEAKLKPTLVNELKALGGGIILYAIIGLIIAASIKKKAPLSLSMDEESPAP